MRLEEVNRLELVEFGHEFGAIAERAPWVALAAARQRPFETRDDMLAAFEWAIDQATHDEQLALLREHPELGTRAAASAEALTPDSAREQKGAGLDRLGPADLARFAELNAAYRERFGFPFILAVKGATKDQILAAFEQRLSNPPEIEFATALGHVKNIVRFRLEERVAG